MFLLTFSNINIQFTGKKLISKSYTTIKIPPTIKQTELIDKKKIAKVALKKDIEAFIIYLTSKPGLMSLHLS